MALLFTRLTISRLLALLLAGFVVMIAALLIPALPAGAEPDEEGPPPAGLSAQATIPKSGTLAGSETWTAGNTYQITGDVTVPAGATLTIQAGTTVAVDSGRRLIVRGSLQAIGATGSPVVFTRSGASGSWNLTFAPGSTGTIDRAQFSYLGTGNTDATGSYRYVGLLIDGSSPTIANSTFANTEAGYSYTIFVQDTATSTGQPALSGNTIDRSILASARQAASISSTTFSTTTVAAAAIEVPGGTLTSTVTWSGTNSNPYRISNDLTISTTATLTLQPGAAVAFDSGRHLIVRGGLQASRSPEQGSILFTRSGASGTWNLAFAPDSTGTIDRAQFSYLGTGAYDAAGGYRYVGILIDGSSPTIANSTFANTEAGYPAIHVQDAATSNARPSLTGNTLDQAIRTATHSVPGIAANSFVTTSLAIQVEGGLLTTSAVWPATNSNPYRLLSTLVITPSASLGLAAGTSVLIDDSLGLDVRGGLYVTGTSALSVTLATSSGSSSRLGRWQGVFFKPGSRGSLVGLRLLNSGAGLYNTSGQYRYAGIHVEDADPVIAGTFISDTHPSGSSVFVEEASRLPTLTGNTVDESIRTTLLGAAKVTGIRFLQSDSRILIAGTTLGSSATWASGNGHYEIESTLTISPAATLTLQPGVELRFPGSTQQLVISGTLNAAGTADQPITFTSVNTTNPSPGAWGGLFFRAGSAGTLDRVFIRYAGNYQYYTSSNYLYASILAETSTLTIANATIEQSYGHGLALLNGAAPTITGSTFRMISPSNPDGYRAVFTEDPATGPTIAGSTFISTSVRVPIDRLDRLSGNSFQGTGFGVEPLGTKIGRDHTWSNPGGPYRLLDSLEVPSPHTLSVQAGTTIQLPDSRGIAVTGTIYLSGTVDSPVTLTTNRTSNPVPGSWGGLAIRSGGRGAIDRAAFRYGGGTVYDSTNTSYNAALLLDSVNVPVSNSTFEQVYGDAIIVTGDVAPRLTGNTFQPLANPGSYYGIRAKDLGTLPVISGNTFISASVRIPPDAPPSLSGNQFSGAAYVDIDPGANSRIDANATWPNPGTAYRILGSLTVPTIYTLSLSPGTTLRLNGGLTVNGTFNAIGTAAAPITLTANSATPSRGSWSGLDFTANSFGTLAFAHISYAGTGVQVRSATVSVSNSTIDFSSGDDIRLSSNPVVQIRQNNLGAVNCGSFAVNYGDWSDAKTPVDATNNWWGDPLGPSGEAFGSGAPVSKGVTFSPWLKVPAEAPALLPGSAIGCAPYVYSVDPAFGSTGGTTPVTIQGSYFRVGAQAALIRRSSVYTLTDVVFVNGSTLQGTVPAGVPEGIYDLRVVNLDGSTQTAKELFSVSGDAPSPQRVLPPVGFFDAPTDIQIEGFNFREGTTIALKTTFGSEVVLTRTAFLNSTRIDATVPRGFAQGSYDVILRNPNVATPGTLRNGFSIVTSDKLDLFVSSYDIWTSPATPRLGSEVTLGVNVNRRGGTETVQVPVKIYLGDPAQGGQLLGSATTSPIPPSTQIEYVTIQWTPTGATQQGPVQIFVQIDPDNTLKEDNRFNNGASRTVVVQQAASDNVPPDLTDLQVNNGNAVTTQPQIKVDLTANDPAPGTGLKGMYLVEREFNSSARDWVPISNTGWITFQNEIPLSLTDRAGIRYIQAYVSDGAGNISLNRMRRQTNYLPPSDTLKADQVRVYRRTLAAGESLTVRLQPSSGDPDLYVWDRNGNSVLVRNNTGTTPEEGTFTAATAGVYQIEVFAYTATTYRLTLTGGAQAQIAGFLQALAPIGPSEENPRRSAPIIAVTNEPGDQSSVPVAPIGEAAVAASGSSSGTPTPTATAGSPTATATAGTPRPTGVYLPLIGKTRQGSW